MTNYMTKIDLPLYASETINFLQLKSSKLQNVCITLIFSKKYIYIYNLKDSRWYNISENSF